jgi:hypothetical protein
MMEFATLIIRSPLSASCKVMVFGKLDIFPRPDRSKLAITPFHMKVAAHRWAAL